MRAVSGFTSLSRTRENTGYIVYSVEYLEKERNPLFDQTRSTYAIALIREHCQCSLSVVNKISSGRPDYFEKAVQTGVDAII